MIRYAIAMIAPIMAYAVDAGSISKDIEKQLNQVAKPSVKAPALESSSEAAKKPEAGVTVLVRSFKITGNTLISSSELSSVLERFINKQLSFSQLEDATRAVADYYRSKGYSARAFLPPQEVENGMIEIIVLEGKLSAIEIEAETLKRFSAEKAKAIIETAHPTGKVLEIDKLQKGMLLLGDTPGISSSGSLEAGRGAGDSKLKVKLQDAPLINGMALFSNNGARSTGYNQGIVSLGINSPSGIGDQITLQTMATHGIRYAKGGYSLPAGTSGARVGLSYSAMSYYVVEGSKADGRATDTGISFTYPLIRSGATNITFNSEFNHKNYANYTAQVLTSDKSADVLSNGLTFTQYGNGGQTSLGATLSLGYLDLTNSESDYTADQQTKQSNGHYTKLSISASRSQMLNETTFLSASITGQKSSRNLDSSEKMYLGGSGGVRAYPANEAGGDEGYLINLELSKSLPNNINTAIFYDYGRIKQNHTLYSGAMTSTNPYNIYNLKGCGISAAYTYGTLSFKGSLAWRVGTNPNTQADGSDNDGTKDPSRFWLSMTKTF